MSSWDISFPGGVVCTECTHVINTTTNHTAVVVVQYTGVSTPSLYTVNPFSRPRRGRATAWHLIEGPHCHIVARRQDPEIHSNQQMSLTLVGVARHAWSGSGPRGSGRWASRHTSSVCRAASSAEVRPHTLSG